MPLSNQVPASEPMVSNISMAPIAELMLFTILPSISGQVKPHRKAIIPATPEANNKAI